jgi:hypothetical protein
MFVIRAAFGLAIIVMLLPTDEAQQAKVAGTAGAALERAATFCERNAATCAAGAELWVTFVKKAEFGARLAGNMASDYMKSGSRQAASETAAPRQPLDPSYRPQPAPAAPSSRVAAPLAPATWRRPGAAASPAPGLERSRDLPIDLESLECLAAAIAEYWASQSSAQPTCAMRRLG